MVNVFPDPESLSEAAAERFAEITRQAAQQHGRCSVALAGGNTPKRLYEILNERYRTELPWDRIHLFWGDERYVSHDDPKSNYRLVKESLLEGITIPAANIHPVPTWNADPAEAAKAYENEIEAFFGKGKVAFDLVLLGLGGDGHTASIFPDTDVAVISGKVTAATTSPVAPYQRITLTPEVLEQAVHVLFLVAGKDKANIFAKVIGEVGSKTSIYPAARIAGTERVEWYIDQDVQRPG